MKKTVKLFVLLFALTVGGIFVINTSSSEAKKVPVPCGDQMQGIETEYEYGNVYFTNCNCGVTEGEVRDITCH